MAVEVAPLYHFSTTDRKNKLERTLSNLGEQQAQQRPILVGTLAWGAKQVPLGLVNSWGKVRQKMG